LDENFQKKREENYQKNIERERMEKEIENYKQESERERMEKEKYQKKIEEIENKLSQLSAQNSSSLQVNYIKH
jgi:hypothetical protein